MRERAAVDNAWEGSSYTPIKELGAGGFGSVYAAIDRRTGQRVAIKRLERTNPGALVRFKQEFRAVQDIHHPNLVTLKELFEYQGHFHIAMELVEGVDLLTAVRGPENDNDICFEERRLRSVFLQIARGLETLHSHGILHRDLKPSNVRVTPDGRAVLLDFGLVTGMDEAEQSTHALGLGTAAYMAPEQAAADKLGPAADLYALGTCLYEALTGRVPFEGTGALQVVLTKQTEMPEAPSAVAPRIPRDLDSLCMRLLAPRPEHRPSMPEVIAALGGGLSGVTTGHAVIELGEAFEGRDGELETILSRFARTQQGELHVVLIEGESGVGKSALASETVRRLRAKHPGLWVLRGRCYENEQISFKAFDGCVSDLGRQLKRMREDTARALLPRRAGLLAQLFPALRDVPAVLDAGRNDAVSADPTARRVEAFAALTSLLGKIAADRPLVLVIDDWQWADAESFRLLRALLEDDDPPPMLILGTVRPREELDPDTRAELEYVRSRTNTSMCSLVGLPKRQAQVLAGKLLGPDAPPHWLSIIAEESGGHPLFLGAMVEYAASYDLGSGARISLEGALMHRVRTLSSHARELLDLVVLAGRPYGAHVYARALDWDEALLEQAQKALLAKKLVRSGRGAQLSCFHDLIRTTIHARIGQLERPTLHRRLARALEQETALDASERARHWHAAGEIQLALAAYRRAAQDALESLAFAHAAQLCQRALELCPTRDAPWLELTVWRGNALARGGRSGEAARVYETAAQVAEGDERLRLRGLHAQQLLHSAQLDAGMHAAGELLRELGAPMPKSMPGALGRIAWERTCMSFRGRLEMSERTEPCSPRERLQLDALSALALPVGWVDVLTGVALSTAHLRRALSAGDKAHAARALAQEASGIAMQHPKDARVREILTRARGLAADVGDPAALAFVDYCEGTASLLADDFHQATARFEAAAETLQRFCPGEPHLLTVVRSNLGAAWNITGQYKKLKQQSLAWLKDAREREDCFAIAALCTLGRASTRHLIDDTADATFGELRDATSPWSAAPFGLVHMGEALLQVEAEMYVGDARAYERVEPTLERLEQSLLGRARLMKATVSAYRASAQVGAMACASGTPPDSAVASVRKLLEINRAASGDVERTAALLAQLQFLSGEKALARQTIGIARRWAERAGYEGLAPAIAYFEGALTGGVAGDEMCEAALAFYAQQGWARPDRAIVMGVPATQRFGLGHEAQRTARQLVHDRYRILRALGAGGYGKVFEARDERTGRHVALKELTSTSPAALARFKQEFRALQDLHHPNLIRLDALIEHDGRWLIVMEHVVGVSLLARVREEGAFDEGRLRAALLGITRGLLALHDAGFVHRGLTPEHVLIDGSGRVVLIDFGLLATHDQSSTETGLPMGIAAYTAPEQVNGALPNERFDAYALGVCLFEAVTGTLPFRGPTPLSILQQKERAEAPTLSSTGVNVSAELELWCMRLLAREPVQRMTVRELAAELLGTPLARTSFPPPAMSLPPGGPLYAFVGRGDELKQLGSAFEAARAAKKLSCVLIQAESGLGKSALVAEHVRRLRQRDPRTLVLEGRCYENEEVAFKGIDEAVDQLAKALRRMPDGQVTTLLPQGAAVLSALFPVLGTVRGIASAPRKGIPADPSALRLRAMRVLRDLFVRLCEVRPVVLALDDLHYADMETWRLLADLLADRDAPALYVVCTLLPDDALARGNAVLLEGVRNAEATRTVTLAPLSPAEARNVARAILGPEAPAEQADRLAFESRGNPLLLGELSRASAFCTPLRGPHVTIEQSLASRIDALPEDARELLRLVALAGLPYGEHVFARALGRESDLGEPLAVLLAEKLVRTRQRQSITCLYDQVRRVALETMEMSTRKRLCGALAEALDGEREVDLAQRARLWDVAGDRDRALLAYEDAGRAALSALAFGQAERLFARALELLGDDRPELRQHLLVGRARALASAGRSTEAATLYGEAAQTAKNAERVRLRTLTAQQLIQACQFDAGMRAAEEILEELGEPVPKTARAAVSRLFWDRALLSARGLTLTPVEEANIGERDRLTLDALRDLSLAIGCLDPMRGAALNIRHLRRALGAGHAAHTARALAQEGCSRALQRPEKREAHERLLVHARELSVVQQEPAAEAYHLVMEGIAANLRAEFATARELLGAAHDLLETRCAGESWLLTIARTTLNTCRLTCGEHKLLATSVDGWLAEARDRGDHYATTALTGLGHGWLRHAMRNEPEAGLSDLDRVMATWPREPFALVHLGELLGRCYLHLYLGGPGITEWLDERRAEHERAFLSRARFGRDVLLVLRSNATLLASAEAPAMQRRALALSLRSKMRALRRSGSISFRVAHEAMEAQVAWLRGELDLALLHTRNARARCAELNEHHQFALSYFEGLIVGGEEGRALREHALAFYREQGWQHPERALGMWLPAVRAE